MKPPYFVIKWLGPVTKQDLYAHFNGKEQTPRQRFARKFKKRRKAECALDLPGERIVRVVARGMLQRKKLRVA